MIGTQDAISNSEFAAILTAVYVPFVVLLAWILGGKQLRRWWRRRKLNIPEGEENVRTIDGPLWEVGWIKVSEVGEKYPEEQRSTVLGNDLPQVVMVLKAKFGDEFEERNMRRASKHTPSMSSWEFRERRVDALFHPSAAEGTEAYQGIYLGKPIDR